MRLIPVRRRGLSMLDPGGEAARAAGCECKFAMIGPLVSIFGLERCPLHGPQALSEVTDHDRRMAKNLEFFT